VFIVSTPRSGSTLLRAMLAQHPKLFSPPELHLLPFFSLQERQTKTTSLGCEWMQRGLVSAIVELEGVSPGAAKMKIANLAATGATIDDVYSTLASLAGGRTLVDKTPTYGFHKKWLENAERRFRESRYIFLIRHPIANSESFVRLRLHRLLGPRWLVWDENPWRFAEKCWCSSNLHIEELLKDVQTSRQIEIRYEDLVQDPEAILSRICDFLKLKYCPEMLFPYRNKNTLVDSENHSATLGDPTFLNHYGIEKPRVLEQSCPLRAASLNETTIRIAGRFDYSLELQKD
jgi:hypothetical protein